MNRSIPTLPCLAMIAALACDAQIVGRPDPVAAQGPDTVEPDRQTSLRSPLPTDEVDPCVELGVIVPRLSIELHAPRTGVLRGGSSELHDAGEPVYVIEAGDDVAVLEVGRAELEEAKAARERYAAEQRARARELRSAEQLGEYLASQDRDAASEAHSVATREVHRADALRRAASARLEAQQARIHAGRLEAPFRGELVRELAIPGAWVEAGQALARFASTRDLVLRVGLPAEQALPTPISVRWRWPERDGEWMTATLLPISSDVDELSGLRLYEARVDASSLQSHALGDGVEVELPTCHGAQHPEGEQPDHDRP